MKLPYRERFFAATSLFSMLAVIIVRLLGIVTDLNKRFGFGIDAKAWEEQVILTDQDDEIVSQKMVLLPYGTKLAEGVDPSTLPGAVDATSLTEFRRAIQPECAADAFFLHEKETIGEFHAIYSWKNGILTVLVADALLLEFDTTKKHGAEAYVNSSFTPNAEAVKRLLPTVRKSDLVRIVIPCGDGKNLYAIYPLAMATDDTKSDRGWRALTAGLTPAPTGRMFSVRASAYMRPSLGVRLQWGRFHLRSEDRIVSIPTAATGQLPEPVRGEAGRRKIPQAI
ncbi:hypothetical protein ACR73R_02750 [Bifidobacterium longum subsp. longum]|uniref:hypothetical protein n=2 Tax=Bifidobacterium longum TaxID=216816 RepID=UPI003DA62B0F